MDRAELARIADLARASNPELGAIENSLVDYFTGKTVATFDNFEGEGANETALFLASAREVVLRLIRRVVELEEGSERETDYYRRMYQVCHTALLAIAIYSADGRDLEQYAHDQGIPVGRYRDTSQTHWEYLRKLDYEIAQSALARSLGIEWSMKSE